MGIKEWKAKYYFVEADQIKGKLNALQHSLLKWEGARPKALKEFGVRKLSGSVRIVDDDGDFGFVIGTCALCNLYRKEVIMGVSCKRCPLAKNAGKNCYAQYDKFMENDKPEPMISLIKRAIQELKKEK